MVAIGGGTAIAVSLPKNSVGPKQIEKNAVGAPEVRKNAVASGEVKNDKLTGADVDESTLGEVARAANAGNSQNAANAENAANAGALDGLDSSEFLRANRATLRGPVNVDDDPASGGHTDSPALMTAGPVTFVGRCTDTGPQRIASVNVGSATPGAQIAGIVQSQANEQAVTAFQTTVPSNPNTTIPISETPNTGIPTARTTSFSLIHPGTATYTSGTVYAAVNVGGDCTFGVTGFG